MAARVSVGTYLLGPETNRPMELVYGRVREPPAPLYCHQALVTRVGSLLYQHVRDGGLGQVCVSPVDVVLDQRRALIVQPDVIFISEARKEIIRDVVWGAPDLAIEVLSRRTVRHDRRTKLRWYTRYGVRECWFLDPGLHQVDIIVCARPGLRRSVYKGDAALQSRVLPSFDMPASALFE